MKTKCFISMKTTAMLWLEPLSKLAVKKIKRVELLHKYQINAKDKAFEKSIDRFRFLDPLALPFY